MSFALSTVLLFLIVVPGLVARFCYFTYPFSNDARAMDLLTEVFWSVVPGFGLQFAWVKLVEGITSWRISFPIIGELLIGIKDDNAREISRIMDNIHSHIWPIVIYQLLLILASGGFGFLLKRIVLKFSLDTKFRFLRFSNKWYYILSGRILDMDDSPSSSMDVTIIGIDLLCKVGNEVIIYTGQLVNYYLNNSGDLDAVIIKYPFRRKFVDDNAPDKQEAYYEIPSDFMYIPYRDVVNVNINYFNLS
jgi:hypothetical protein